MKKSAKKAAGQKRKTKAVAKAKARRKAFKKRPKSLSGMQRLDAYDGFPEVRKFWKAHGVNYILSDYDNGTWTPLFEEIYENGEHNPDNPDDNEIARRVLDKFGPDQGNWPDEGRAALAWLVSPDDVLKIYWQKAMMDLITQDADTDLVDLYSPHNSTVWQVLEYLKGELTKRTA